MTTYPKVTRIPDLNIPERASYLVEGGAIDPDWASALRTGEAPFCEITIWNHSDQIASYRGNVWPGAWPALFRSLRGIAQSGPQSMLTAEGQEMVSRADDLYAVSHAEKPEPAA